MRVIDTDQLPEYVAPQPNPRKAKILLDEEIAGAKHAAVGLGTYEPGQTADMHTHTGEELMFVLDGEGVILDAANNEFPIKKGSAIYAPPGEPHALKNTGKETLRFIFVYAPPGPEKLTKKNWEKVPPR